MVLSVGTLIVKESFESIIFFSVVNKGLESVPSIMIEHAW